MMDGFRTYLSRRRAALLLLVATVAVAALAGLGAWLALSGLGAGDLDEPEGIAPPASGLTEIPCTEDYFGHVRNQLLFPYQQEPDDPAAAIEAALLTAGVEFESVTVRLATFPLALALNVYVENFSRNFESRPPSAIYQANLHGYPGDVRWLRVPGASHIALGSNNCGGSPGLPDLYAAFGDDVAIDGEAADPEFVRLREQRSSESFAGEIVLSYHSSTFREVEVDDGPAFIELVRQDWELRRTIEDQVRRDLRLSGVPNAITRIEIIAQGDSLYSGYRSDSIGYGRVVTRPAHYMNVRVKVEGDFLHELPVWSRTAAAEFSALNAAADRFRRDERHFTYLEYSKQIHLSRPVHAISAEAVYLDEEGEEFWLHTGLNRIADLQGGVRLDASPRAGR